MNRDRNILFPQFVEFPDTLRPSDAAASRSVDSLRNVIDTGREDILDSSKQIAVYLGRDVRTVQRWEKCEKLPAHRHIHYAKASIYAFKSEIDVWHKNRSSCPGSLSLMQLAPQKNGRVSRQAEIEEAGHQVHSRSVPKLRVKGPELDRSTTFVFCIPGFLFGPTVICLSGPNTASIRGEHQWNGSPRNTKKSI